MLCLPGQSDRRQADQHFDQENPGMKRLLTSALAAMVGAAAIGTAVAAADTSPTPPIGAPSSLYKKSIRMDVSLQDTTGLVFDASLDQVASSMPARFGRYLETQLDGEIFSIDVTGARCFVDDGTATKAVTCQQVADLIDTSVDVIPATVLARAVPGTPLDFVAKKVIAHSDGLVAAPTSQAARIDVSLSYAESDTLIDASLDSVDDSVPARLAALIDNRLGAGTFTLDTSRAVCSIVSNGASERASCHDVADLVNSSYDTVSATVIGRLTTATDGTTTFVASKVVADADSATSNNTSNSDGESAGAGYGSGQAGGWLVVPLPGRDSGPFGRHG
jgi:hypothetical protein